MHFGQENAALPRWQEKRRHAIHYGVTWPSRPLAAKLENPKSALEPMPLPDSQARYSPIPGLPALKVSSVTRAFSTPLIDTVMTLPTTDALSMSPLFKP